jgi:hypothetical protein|tara:strand:- start:320 stop:646 length:327 start_codon:yes stop_codon:yes gene_type:complete
MQQIKVNNKTFTKQKEFVDFAGKAKKTWDQCNTQLDIIRDLGIGEIFGDAFKAEIKAGISSQIDYQLLAQNIANHFGVGCSVTEATAFVKNSKIKKPSRHKVTFSTTK